jgi:subtilisin family serine protease
MKKIFYLAVLCLNLVPVNAQDSLYYYNPDGTKNWWYLQSDVILFKNDNNLITSIQLDSTIVDQLNYWSEDYRKFNEVLINSSTTLTELQALRDTILNSPEFEVFAPAITKYPYIGYAQERFSRTDDQILITFHDPLIDDNTINSFMMEYGLALVHKPSPLLDNTKNWTYVFKVKAQADTMFNSILIANTIFEFEPTLVKISQPNIYSGDYSACQTVTELGLITGGTNGTWNIQNNGGVIWNSTNGEPGYKLSTNPIEYFTTNTYTNNAIGHGMSVAGFIGATPNNISLGQRYAVGTAYGAEIHPYLLNSINSADIIKGLQQAILDDIDVLNMSFRLAYDASVALQLDNCAQIGRPSTNAPNGYFGMILVASTGNDNLQASNFPANHPSVIGVGMSNPNDYRSSENAPIYSWSMNPGDGTTYGPPSFGYDVVAPGELMMTIDLTGSLGASAGDYLVGGGTSFASPIVASIAALILEKNPNLSLTEVRDLIRNGAEKKHPTIYNYNMFGGTPGYNDEMFYGRVSCINSINSVPLGIDDLESISKLNIIRLNENDFVLFIPESNDFQDIEVINSIGQKIKTLSIEPNQISTDINLSNCSNGIYFILLKNKNGQIYLTKILK